MAFDLNKNDGSNQDSSNKTSTKFDLSKTEAENVVITDPSSKSKIWIFGLVGLLIIGGGVWYYSSPAKTEITKDNATTAVASADSTVKTPSNGAAAAVVPAAKDVAVAGRPVANESVSAGTDLEETKDLNHKIPATFALGSSSLVKVDQSLIRRIKSYLAKNTDASIHVNGYASSDGSLEINQAISQARADAFKKYLVSKNIIENKVVALGKGIENPIASNDTDAGRKKNRRVEITLP